MVDSVENNSSDDSAASPNADSAANGGMNRAQRLQEKLLTVLAGIGDMSYDFGEVTLEVKPSELLTTCEALRDHSELAFAQLVDLCGVDYATYGKAEWSTDTEAGQGFSRAVDANSVGRLSFGNSAALPELDRPRFAVVYHLLSIDHNFRLRVRCYCENDDFPVVPSVNDLWNSADWYERECFDLYGILFEGHDDLRRLLTDYGFVGHPFRKDFPLIGNVEMRYDPEVGRVVYEPVTIEPRVLVPRVIRTDNRYSKTEEIQQGAAEAAEAGSK